MQLRGWGNSSLPAPKRLSIQGQVGLPVPLLSVPPTPAEPNAPSPSTPISSTPVSPALPQSALFAGGWDPVSGDEPQPLTPAPPPWSCPRAQPAPSMALRDTPRARPHFPRPLWLNRLGNNASGLGSRPRLPNSRGWTAASEKPSLTSPSCAPRALNAVPPLA